MSIFRPIHLKCPACQANVDFQAVHSVNADRRPDLRESILTGTFQQERCGQCGELFRLDPDFNLMDTQRGQWVAAAALAKLSDWVEVEKHARELFDRAFGAEANSMAQEIGKSLTPRVTFGWPALREKLLAGEHLLDDVVLELCKMFVMRNSDSYASAETELRLIGVADRDLILGWVVTADGTPGPTVRLARTVYDQIAADEEGDWEEIKETFDNVFFVDLNRFLMAGQSNEGGAGPGVTPPESPGAPPSPPAQPMRTPPPPKAESEAPQGRSNSLTIHHGDADEDEDGAEEKT